MVKTVHTPKWDASLPFDEIVRMATLADTYAVQAPNYPKASTNDSKSHVYEELIIIKYTGKGTLHKTPGLEHLRSLLDVARIVSPGAYSWN